MRERVNEKQQENGSSRVRNKLGEADERERKWVALGESGRQEKMARLLESRFSHP